MTDIADRLENILRATNSKSIMVDRAVLAIAKSEIERLRVIEARWNPFTTVWRDLWRKKDSGGSKN